MHAPVSVIIPCYRCADTIERAVESVIAQTWPPKEILLVEDWSKDDGKTLFCLKQLQQKHQGKVNFIIIQLPMNCGPGAARNAGWEASHQPYLAFLDADDSWHPRKLEIQFQWMELHPDVHITGHKSIRFGLSNSIFLGQEQVNATQISQSKLLLSNCFPARSVMLRRSKITLRFDPVKRYAEDYLLWLTIVLNGQDAWRLEAPLAYSYTADFGEAGLSGKLWEMEKGELDTYIRIYRDKKISILQLVGLLVFSFIKYFRRVILSFTRKHFGNKMPV